MVDEAASRAPDSQLGAQELDLLSGSVHWKQGCLRS